MLKTHSFLSTFVGMTKKLLFQEKNQEKNQEISSRNKKEKKNREKIKEKTGKKSRNLKSGKMYENKKKLEKIIKIKYGVHFLRVNFRLFFQK